VIQVYKVFRVYKVYKEIKVIMVTRGKKEILFFWMRILLLQRERKENVERMVDKE
jgi:hypothetical protein